MAVSSTILEPLRELDTRVSRIANRIEAIQRRAVTVRDAVDAAGRRFELLTGEAFEGEFRKALSAQIDDVVGENTTRAEDANAALAEIRGRCARLVDTLGSWDVGEQINNVLGEIAQFRDEMVEIAEGLPSEAEQIVIADVLEPAAEEFDTGVDAVADDVAAHIDEMDSQAEDWHSRVEASTNALSEALNMNMDAEVVQSWADGMDEIAGMVADGLASLDSRREETIQRMERVIANIESAFGGFTDSRSIVQDATSTAGSGLEMVAGIFQDVQEILEEVK